MTMNLKLSVWFPLPPSGCDCHHSRVHRKSYWDRSQLSTNSPRAGREKALEASDLIAGVDTQEPTKWERFSTVLVPALCASSEFFGGSTAWGRPWFELVSSEVRNQLDVQPAAGPCTKHVDGQQWRASTRPRGALAGVKNRLCLSASESRAHQTLSRVRIKVFMLDIHRRSPLRRQRRGCASTSRTFQDTTSSPRPDASSFLSFVFFVCQEPR